MDFLLDMKKFEHLTNSAWHNARGKSYGIQHMNSESAPNKTLRIVRENFFRHPLAPLASFAYYNDDGNLDR